MNIERLNPTFRVQIVADCAFKGQEGIVTHMKEPDVYFVRLPGQPRHLKFGDSDLLYLGLNIPRRDVIDDFPIRVLYFDVFGVFMPEPKKEETCTKS